MTEVLRFNRASGVRLIREDDGVFVVMVGDDSRAETRVQSLAEVEFSEAVEESRANAAETLRRERSHYDMQAARSESFSRRAGNARKKGGRGGRGGV